MKLKIILLYIVMFCSCSLYAQQGLNVNPLFQGKIVPQEQLIEVKVKGKSLSKYNLSYYHSIRFKATPAYLKVMYELVEKDEANAIGMEKSVKNKNTTKIISLVPEGQLNRFLCVITETNGKETNVTMVYMDGKVKDINELRKLINK